MPIALQVCDETTAGEKRVALTLEFPSERITVRELIRIRVFQEVKDHNVRRNQAVFHGLVQPSNAERELNGYKLREARQIDWQEQYEAAIAAFARGGFLILVDERQVAGLDEEIVLDAQTQVSFLKLVPLVGG